MAFRSTTEICAFDTPWNELPHAVQQQFTDDERSAYVEGAPFFKRRAKESGEMHLVALTNLLTDDYPMRVYVETEPDALSFVWFAFSYPRIVVHPRLRLSGSEMHAWVPPRLKGIYANFGGICQFSGSECSGLIAPETVRAFSELIQHRALSPQSEFEGYYGFLLLANGDYFCVRVNGDCIAFDHETNVIQSADLDSVVDLYFSSLLRGPDLNAMFGIEE